MVKWKERCGELLQRRFHHQWWLGVGGWNSSALGRILWAACYCGGTHWERSRFDVLTACMYLRWGYPILQIYFKQCSNQFNSESYSKLWWCIRHIIHKSSSIFVCREPYLNKCLCVGKLCVTNTVIMTVYMHSSNLYFGRQWIVIIFIASTTSSHMLGLDLCFCLCGRAANRSDFWSVVSVLKNYDL